MNSTKLIILVELNFGIIALCEICAFREKKFMSVPLLPFIVLIYLDRKLWQICRQSPNPPMFSSSVNCVMWYFLTQPHAWFLEITFMLPKYVCVFVCVSTPEAINN